MHKPGPQEQNENDPHSNARPDGAAVTKGLELDSKLVSRPATPQRRSARSPAGERASTRDQRPAPPEHHSAANPSPETVLQCNGLRLSPLPPDNFSLVPSD